MDPLEIMPAQNADFGDSSKHDCFRNCTTVNPFPSQQLLAIPVLFFYLYNHHLYDPLKTIQSGGHEKKSAHHCVARVDVERLDRGWPFWL